MSSLNYLVADIQWERVLINFCFKRSHHVSVILQNALIQTVLKLSKNTKHLLICT